MRAKVTLATVALLLVAPAGASAAGTVTLPNVFQVAFTAAGGKANHLTATSSTGKVIFTDTGDTITTVVAGCVGSGTPTVTCTIPTITSWSAELGDGIDTSTASGPLFGGVQGGPGNDELTAGPDGLSLTGDEGDDTLIGGPDDDGLSGGEGHDTVTGGGGDDEASGGGAGADSDTISLGEGDDFLFGLGQGAVADLGPGDDSMLHFTEVVGPGSATGGPGVDRLRIGTDIPFAMNLATGSYLNKVGAQPPDSIRDFEDFEGSSALGDSVIGTAGPNLIDTGNGGQMDAVDVEPPSSGNDVVDPLAGADLVSTGDGNDQITSNDGFADRINCGAGTDTVAADQLDELTACENVTVAKARPAGADRTAPVCTFRKAAKKAKRSSFVKSYSATFRCNEAVTVQGRILLSAKRKGGKLKLAKAGDVILAEKSTSAGANVSKKLTLKISRKLRSSLGKKFTARVVLDARDEFGNRKTITRKVKVSTPRKKRKN